MDVARELVEEVLRTAMALEDIVVSLLEDLPAGAFPGEEPGVAAGRRNTRTATALVGAIRERVLADLRVAAVLAAERENDVRK
jgi:hypothetical protein